MNSNTEMSAAAVEARRRYYREWRSKNKERVREYQRNWKRKNREHLKEKEAQYWARKAAEYEAEQNRN